MMGQGTIISEGAVMSEGTVMSSEMAPMEGTVVGETILEAGEVAQESPSDGTITSSEVVEPPAAGSGTKAAMDAVAPAQEN